MKNVIFTKKSLVAITLAAATLVSPLTANAQNFSSRQSNNDAGAQIAGGLIGGSLGAILGEEIAGRGNRTEGAIVGAIIGGVTGAAIGEGIASDNKTTRRVTNNSRFNNSGFTTRISTNNRGFNSNQGFNHRVAASSYTQIDKIDYQLNALKRDRHDICVELEYRGYNPYLKKRLAQIDYEILELKDRRQFLKRKKNTRRFY
ncbi:MAG: glycine zipper 2TM domain-containing protein [Litorimonas sp.]